MTAGIAPCPCGIGDLYEPADAELDICEAWSPASKRAMTPQGLVHEVSVVIKPHVPRFVGTWAGGLRGDLAERWTKLERDRRATSARRLSMLEILTR